jgi:hypothetical protein
VRAVFGLIGRLRRGSGRAGEALSDAVALADEDDAGEDDESAEQFAGIGQLAEPDERDQDRTFSTTFCYMFVT